MNKKPYSAVVLPHGYFSIVAHAVGCVWIGYWSVIGVEFIAKAVYYAVFQ